MNNRIEVNSAIFQLSETFRNLVTFVFENLGKSIENTKFETFNDIGRLRADSATTGFFSFRNDEFFYWIFLKITHSDNSAGSESIRQEFEVQIKKDNHPIFQIYGETFESGQEVSIWKELKNIKTLTVEFDADYTDFAANFTERLSQKLQVKIYEPIV